MVEEMDQTQHLEQLASDFMVFFAAWESYWDYLTNLEQFYNNSIALLADYEDLLNDMHTYDSAFDTPDSSGSDSDSSTEQDDDEEDSSMDEDSCSITNYDSNIDDSPSEEESFGEEYEDLFCEQYVEYGEYYEVEDDDWPMDQDGCY